jgi:HEPN domain-containing protein
MNKQTKITKEQYVKNWMQKADNDLTIARDERYLKNENIVTDGICFHCQQCVEKYLKAFLSFNKIDFQKTHNLEMLSSLCATIDSNFNNLDFGNLTDFGASIRYPDDFYIPTIKEADTSISKAEEIRKFVLDKINRNSQ